MKLYYHPNCSSCKKALKWLESKNIAPETVNLLEQSPTADELQQMTAAYDDNLKKLFNTSGKLYREMQIKDKVAKMTTGEVYALLAQESMLVKRPFFLVKGGGVVGFKEADWEEITAS